MKSQASRIRDEIAKLNEKLKLAETREAERLGRVALKAGLGELDIAEPALLAAFEDVARRFHGAPARSPGKAGELNAGCAEVRTGKVPGGAGEA